MKRVLSLLLVIVMLTALLASCKKDGDVQPEATDPVTDSVEYIPAVTLPDYSIRVMSYNLQISLENLRHKEVLHEIETYAPDLLGLQEDGLLWNAQIKDMMALTHEQVLSWNPDNVKESAYFRWVESESFSYPLPNVVVAELLK